MVVLQAYVAFSVVEEWQGGEERKKWTCNTAASREWVLICTKSSACNIDSPCNALVRGASGLRRTPNRGMWLPPQREQSVNVNQTSLLTSSNCGRAVVARD